MRQLENLCHWLTVMAPGANIDIADLPPEFREEQRRARPRESWISALEQRGRNRAQPRRAKHHARDDAPVRARADLKALAHTGGRRIEASHLLGMGRNTLTRKIQELEIEGKEAAERALEQRGPQLRGYCSSVITGA